MSKVEMRKIEIVALNRDRKKIIERLQRRKAVEISQIDDERLLKIKTDTNIAAFERNISTAVSALECLNRYTDYKPSILSELNGRKAVSTKDFAKSVENANEYLSVCHSILDFSKSVDEAKATVEKLRVRADMLKPWESLEIPIGTLGTRTSKIFIGTLTGMYSSDELEKEIAERITADAESLDKKDNQQKSECAYPFTVDVISSRKEQTCIEITAHKSIADSVNSAIRDMGFSIMSGSDKITPKQEMLEIENEIIGKTKAVSEYSEKIKRFDDRRGDIEFFIDYLTIRRDKYIDLGKLGRTKNTFVIDGYIPKMYVNGLIREFEEKYTIAINIQEPSSDDDVPVMLKNGKFSEPVEGITEMYALPNKRDVDPSSVMAFFYYLFFGMMLSDAGYGLMMLIGTTVVLKKFTVEGTLRRSLTMFRNCAVSTLFWGILFGSWFGDLPQTIASNFFGYTITSTALWFQPLDDPIKLLLFSFALGIAHLFLGVAVNFHIEWKEGKKIDALCDSVPIYLTVLGVAPLGASILTQVPDTFINIGKYLAIIGAVLVLLTSGRSGKNIFVRFFGGVYGLYNTATGYLSDILSYSRLLALGLATGSIASVINLIGTMPQNTVIKAISLIIVGIVGHTANMGINLLGAYVHSDRLQFVELFSKFYEGGGRPFKPLMAKTKYIKFKKENIYE